jgi:hypothetical protein
MAGEDAHKMEKVTGSREDGPSHVVREQAKTMGGDKRGLLGLGVVATNTWRNADPVYHVGGSAKPR